MHPPWKRLRVCPETLEVLVDNGIEVEVLQTDVAVERNKLAESVPVGGLFHSACRLNTPDRSMDGQAATVTTALAS